jgi:hypothetical protein
MSISWSEWFEQEVKLDMREKITNFEDVWELMILSPEKQEVLDTASSIAKRCIGARDYEIIQLEEQAVEMQTRINHLEKTLEHEQMANLMQPRITALADERMIELYKRNEALKMQLEEKDKEITELKTTVQVKDKWLELKEIWMDFKDSVLRDKEKDIEELKAQLDQERNNALSVLEKMKTE